MIASSVFIVVMIFRFFEKMKKNHDFSRRDHTEKS
jgi:hypothetical protein